jgi:choline dehydrogenase
LLLEAGPTDRCQEVAVPAAFSKLFGTQRDWAYATEPQDALCDRELYWPRGKVLGGSSSMNAMIYIRGNRADYDAWREQGNAGWGFDDVLPYFIRAEDNERGASAYHGIGGPLHVADLRTVNPLTRAFVDAAAEAGLATNDDFNGPRQEGAGCYQVTQRRGRRCSAATAYLRPAMRRRNLTVRTGVNVAAVLFEGRRAVGVDCVVDGRRRHARAGREVVLCGGAVNSPQLLLLSGVGPADDLRAAGIDVVADLPGVGRNLQDHPAVPILWLTARTISLAGAESTRHLVDYLVRRRGPLTSNVAEAGGFVHTRSGLPGPDLQYHFAPVIYADHGRSALPGHGYTIAPTLLQPNSRGTIHLRSADPLASPVIEPCYLRDACDLQRLVDGVRLALESPQPRRFAPSSIVACCPGRSIRLPSSSTSAPGRRPSTIPWAHVAWARTRTRSWTRTCASTTSTVCASWTRRSCRPSPVATRTHRPS